ncbi:hypothetical protein IJL65_02930 [bacterium]|nr:hypothetical protein [bacterium]
MARRMLRFASEDI